MVAILENIIKIFLAVIFKMSILTQSKISLIMIILMGVIFRRKEHYNVVGIPDKKKNSISTLSEHSDKKNLNN